ncbi:substrate-binding domain-containing protein [Xanthobacter sp. DSM 24535]|uniref:substrate-binding domain-containing protein n=1 Tax=Roseixanthobacter psychrophilus TaxID=3119917 RepID=UPI00372A1ADD
MHHQCRNLAVALSFTVCIGFANTAMARDQVRMAGSSTVLPYANIVAEQFGKTFTKFKTPLVESGGTGAGLKQFCIGLGEATVDIANASRPIRKDERAACEKAGVKDIIEVKFGYDGIVFASDVRGPSFAFTPKDWYLALAAQVPDAAGKLVSNARKTWKEVNPDLPEWNIAAYIPGEKHGTREVFEERVLHAGCVAVGARDAMIKAGMDQGAADKACVRVRKDSAAVDIDGDYTETLARLNSNKQGLGVFGLAFYENNTDKLKVATMSGVAPSVETIASAKYPVSRPLFFYVKKAHLGVIPGLKEYVEFFISDRTIGPKGPLADYGLVPLPDNERAQVQEMVKNGRTM